jgi:hypothetical protein
MRVLLYQQITHTLHETIRREYMGRCLPGAEGGAAATQLLPVREDGCAAGPHPADYPLVRRLVVSSVQVQVQVCFTSVCGQVQPLDVALSNSV